MRLVECVPNFSEGRNESIIDSITSVIADTDGAHLLDVDPGKDTNRTVVTFVADPDRAVEAAFRAIKRASELIDMGKHSGAHARMGATDVCPFVPVAGVTMEDCVELANELGKRVGEELGIPVYLYENAATADDRRNLASVRSGEYEGLEKKLQDPHWAPDYGPAQFNARSGATAIGARKFLIAYNVNLNTRSQKIANDIAMSIREAGRNKRDERGKFVRDENGVPIKQPGTLSACKAVGWFIDEYDKAQISINLTDFDVTPPHAAFDECVSQAEKRGVRVTGSELVGLVPLEAMLQAGRHYLRKSGVSTGVPEKEVIETAIQSLGLREVSQFDPQQKVIEYRVARPAPLADLTVKSFVDLTSSDAPAPGGGSVAALMASMSGALTSMVANLTVGKRGYKKVWDEMKEVAPRAQELKAAFMRAVDEDTFAFDAVMDAMKLPRKTEEENRKRDAAIERATKDAIEVPFGVLRRCREVLPLVEAVAEKGNVNSLSDAGVAALALRAAAGGALLNVLINLPGISDADYVKRTKDEGAGIFEEVKERCHAVVAKVIGALDESLGPGEQAS
jgi:glutamate formiminotransferase/formiminotetrahydrofolate cyclodeaminase